MRFQAIGPSELGEFLPKFSGKQTSKIIKARILRDFVVKCEFYQSLKLASGND